MTDEYLESLESARKLAEEAVASEDNVRQAVGRALRAAVSQAQDMAELLADCERRAIEYRRNAERENASINSLVRFLSPPQIGADAP